MTDTAHTPTPPNNAVHFWTEEQGDQMVGLADGSVWYWSILKSDWVMQRPPIVRAVNAHEKLIEAAQLFMDAVDASDMPSVAEVRSGRGTGTLDIGRAYDKAREALALAKGEKEK